MTSKSKYIIDLSVDYDFFCREDPMWDWGHQESSVFESGVAWQARYMNMPVHRETSQLKYADVQPTALWESLRDVMVLTKVRKIQLADSHRHAFNFFHQEATPPTHVVNIDAHHDFWPRGVSEGAEPAAENWAAYLYDRWHAVTRFVQVYPRWKDAALDGPTTPRREVVIEHALDDFKKSLRELNTLHGSKPVVRNLFICRSPAWVPPHLDKGLLAMIKGITAMNPTATADYAEPMYKRKAPSQREAEQWWKDHTQRVEEAYASMRDTSEAQDETTT